MSINVEIKKLPESEVEIVGELPADDFEHFRKNAVEKISKEVKLDGFRSGHIPESVLIANIGEYVLLEEMAELALQKFYPAIVSENNLKAIGNPQISITKIAKNNPLGFKIKTAVAPEVKLPEYKKIAEKINVKKKKEKKDAIIDDKEVDEAVEHLRKMRATKGKDGAEDTLPELNDEFAKCLGSFENIDALRNKIRENLVAEKNARTKESDRIAVIEEIIKECDMVVPKTLIDWELEKMTDEMKANISQAGLEWDKYLEKISKKEDELKKEWTDEALKRIKIGLILETLADAEKIVVTADELLAESEKFVNYYKNMGLTVDAEKVKPYVSRILSNEKVFEILENA